MLPKYLRGSVDIMIRVAKGIYKLFPQNSFHSEDCFRRRLVLLSRCSPRRMLISIRSEFLKHPLLYHDFAIVKRTFYTEVKSSFRRKMLSQKPIMGSEWLLSCNILESREKITSQF